MSLGDYYSHYPILAAAVARTEGPVLELGCGEGSTPMLHYVCRDRRVLVTAETNVEWMKRFDGYRSKMHEFHAVLDWESWHVIESCRWAVAFVDCQPGEARTPIIRRLVGHAHFVVVHDTEKDYGSGADYKYEQVTPLYKYVSEWRRHRPYTMVLSNDDNFFIEECDRLWDPANPK